MSNTTDSTSQSDTADWRQTDDTETLQALLEQRKSERDALEAIQQAYHDEVAAALAARGPHSEDFYLDCSPEQLLAILAQYSEGDTVRYGEGEDMVGVVTAVMTDDFTWPTGEDSEEDVEASSDSPVYVVARGDREGMDYFQASDLESATIETDLDDPTEALEEENDSEAAELLTESELVDRTFDYPRSWRQSDTPSRLILLKAWAALGGRFTSCVREMRGDVRTPKRFCASMKDRALGTEKWRGRF